MITQEKVKEVKRYLKRQWHDQKWHDLINRDEYHYACMELTNRNKNNANN